MKLFALACALLTTVASANTALAAADQIVVMQTTKGPVVMRIFYSMVPYTAGNFLDLVSKGFYDGLSFHRVETWCVQGGDPNGNGTGAYIDPSTGQPRYLNLETHRALGHNVAGVVAMARGNNRNSASCQFYILKNPMPGLNGQYAVFGKVIDGMGTVYKLRPGDRILSASIEGGGGGSAASSSGGSAAAAGAPAGAGFGDEPQGYQGGPAPRTVDSGF